MAKRFTDQQFADSLERIVGKAGALGVSAAVIQGGRRWIGTGGYRTSAKQDRLECSAKFPIFSITKTLMAVMALRLVESGRLALDDNIATRIGKYEILEWTAASGQGTVCRAQDSTLDRIVAAGLDHPNLTTVYMTSKSRALC